MSRNGLNSFSRHADNTQNIADMVMGIEAGLGDDFSLGSMDPETAARHYLQGMMPDDGIAGINPVEPAGQAGELKVLGTERLPFTNTQTVKFRQYFNKVPVYGSIVTVELEMNNNLVAINSATADLPEIDSVARISPAEAVASVEAHAGSAPTLQGGAPRLHYYFASEAEGWRLVYILEDIVLASRNDAGEEENKGVDISDFIVDAHSGEILAQMPRMHSISESAVDDLGTQRTIECTPKDNSRHLHDSIRNVHTYDFRFRGIFNHTLPGQYVSNPPQPWSTGAVSAHANAADIADFIRTVLQRNGLDGQGGKFVSSVNCVEVAGTQEWRNAAWIGGLRQMVYGQKMIDGRLRSYAASLDVVAHEMFHGITDHTARLEYSGMYGALNESYSDIFGIIISNMGQPDIGQWNWVMGEDLDQSGIPIRSLRNPSQYGVRLGGRYYAQPEHMDDYVALPANRANDWGGVHINSGIHNKAAYNLLTSLDDAGGYLFDPRSISILFYLALTQYLGRRSTFVESRRAVDLVARTLFRNDASLDAKMQAVGRSFDDVGIV